MQFGKKGGVTFGHIGVDLETGRVWSGRTEGRDRLSPKELSTLERIVENESNVEGAARVDWEDLDAGQKGETNKKIIERVSARIRTLRKKLASIGLPTAAIDGSPEFGYAISVDYRARPAFWRDDGAPWVLVEQMLAARDQQVERFRGRASLVEDLLGMLGRADTSPLIIVGGQGTGKTALLSVLSQRVSRTIVVVADHIERESDFVDSLLEQARPLLGDLVAPTREPTSQSGPDALNGRAVSRVFHRLARLEEPVTVFVDGWDELEFPAAELLPRATPTGLRLVVASCPGPELEALELRLETARRHVLKLSRDDVPDILGTSDETPDGLADNDRAWEATGGWMYHLALLARGRADGMTMRETPPGLAVLLERHRERWSSAFLREALVLASVWRDLGPLSIDDVVGWAAWRGVTITADAARIELLAVSDQLAAGDRRSLMLETRAVAHHVLDGIGGRDGERLARHLVKWVAGDEHAPIRRLPALMRTLGERWDRRALAWMEEAALESLTGAAAPGRLAPLFDEWLARHGMRDLPDPVPQWLYAALARGVEHGDRRAMASLAHALLVDGKEDDPRVDELLERATQEPEPDMAALHLVGLRAAWAAEVGQPVEGALVILRRAGELGHVPSAAYATSCHLIAAWSQGLPKALREEERWLGQLAVTSDPEGVLLALRALLLLQPEIGETDVGLALLERGVQEGLTEPTVALAQLLTGPTTVRLGNDELLTIMGDFGAPSTLVSARLLARVPRPAQDLDRAVVLLRELDSPGMAGILVEGLLGMVLAHSSDAGERSEGRRLLRRLDAAGHPAAAHSLVGSLLTDDVGGDELVLLLDRLEAGSPADAWVAGIAHLRRKDGGRAMRALRRAVDLGFTEAANALFWAGARGQLELDAGEGRRLATRLVEAGHSNGQLFLGWCRVVGRDDIRAGRILDPDDHRVGLSSITDAVRERHPLAGKFVESLPAFEAKGLDGWDAAAVAEIRRQAIAEGLVDGPA